MVCDLNTQIHVNCSLCVCFGLLALHANQLFFSAHPKLVHTSGGASLQTPVDFGRGPSPTCTEWVCHLLVCFYKPPGSIFIHRDANCAAHIVVKHVQTWSHQVQSVFLQSVFSTFDLVLFLAFVQTHWMLMPSPVGFYKEPMLMVSSSHTVTNWC